MKNYLKQNEIAVFIILVFALSWFPWYTGIATETVIFMPSILGVALAFAFGGKEGGRKLLRSVVRWRAGIGIWFTAIFGTLFIFIIGLGIYLLVGGEMPPFIMIKEELNLLPLYLVIVVLLPFNGPIGEELGWRGFALPRLQNKYSPLIASIVIGVVWGIWHLPSFFAERGVIAGLGIGFLIPYILGTIANSVFMTWLYNKTKASVLIAGIVWHAATDFWAPIVLSDGSLRAAQAGTSLPGIESQLYGIVLAVLVAGAVILVIATGGKLGFTQKDVLVKQNN